MEEMKKEWKKWRRNGRTEEGMEEPKKEWKKWRRNGRNEEGMEEMKKEWKNRGTRSGVSPRLEGSLASLWTVGRGGAPLRSVNEDSLRRGRGVDPRMDWTVNPRSDRRRGWLDPCSLSVWAMEHRVAKCSGLMCPELRSWREMSQDRSLHKDWRYSQLHQRYVDAPSLTSQYALAWATNKADQRNGQEWLSHSPYAPQFPP